MKPYNQLRIIFIGTPDFAVASLDALVAAGCNIVAVITAPDKPAGRGMQMHASAVKEYTLSYSLPVLQPVKLKDDAFITELKNLQADLQVVVAFRMLPELVWNMPPMGTINVHASLLPQYRGAAPINWAIINGETETGVTTFKLQHSIDTGNILLQQKVAILPSDNAGSLHDKLMTEGANLLVKTVKGLADNTLKEISQKDIAETDLKHAPKLFRQHMLINWDNDVEAIHNLVRGLAPYPACHAMLGDKSIKIYSTSYSREAHGNPPGTVETTNSILKIAANNGWLIIHELQQEGKKRLSAEDFLRGYRK